jgi:hypothetical protein
MRELAEDLKKLSEANPFAEKPHVSVDFVAKVYVSGRAWKGARYTGYSKTEKQMNFQALVPEEMTRNEAWDYVLKTCTQAVEEAAVRYRKRKLHFDAERLIRVLGKIRKKRMASSG